jgi:HK97 gp10 family phage protein
MNIDLKIDAAAVLKLLHELPAEVVSKRGGPVRSALRKAALVIHKQAKTNLLATIGGDAEDVQSTKLLEQNLIVTRGRAPAYGKGERYLVRVRRKSYNRKGKPVTTLKTAQIKEYGSSKQAPEPWIRPAFNAKATEAIRTAETELVKSIDRIVKKLAKSKTK